MMLVCSAIGGQVRANSVPGGDSSRGSVAPQRSEI